MKRIIPVALILALAMFSQAQAASTLCYTVAACVLGANFGPGPGGAGVEGQAQNTYGVLGVSSNAVGTYGRSTNYFGVVGVTQGTGQPVAGVYGVDSSTALDNAGVLGNSARGYGVEGITGTGIAVLAQSSGGNAVEGDVTNSASRTGIAGAFNANQGLALVAITGSGPALYANSAGGGLTAQFYNGVASDDIILGNSPSCTCFYFDGYGNEYLYGSLVQNGATQVRTHSASGDVTTYGARSASPTLEDTGTAKLTNGAAFVALDKTFASTIAPNYEVLVTPHGDSNGLYTEQLSSNGFAVRENKGGRSTLTFDYRIVAKPLDTKSARLAVMAPMKSSTALIKPVLPKTRVPTLPRSM